MYSSLVKQNSQVSSGHSKQSSPPNAKEFKPQLVATKIVIPLGKS